MKETKKQIQEDMPAACSRCNGHSTCATCSSSACSPEHNKFILLRWLLGILILVITFWLGAKVGEFKSQYLNNGFGSNYGNHFMMTRPYPNMMFSTGQDDLQPITNPESQATTQPPPTTKPIYPNKLK